MGTLFLVVFMIASLLCIFLGVLGMFGLFGEANFLLGVALLVGGFALFFLITILATRTARALKKRFKQHEAYERATQINYVSEIEAVRKKYWEDGSSAKNKELKSYYRWDRSARFTVLKTGKICYASLVQVNEVAFDNSYEHWAFPGVVVYSPDRYFDTYPQELNKIAHRLFADKESNILSREMERFSHLPINRSITGGREVYMTWVDFHRAFLPVGYMTGWLFPIIVDKEQDEHVYVLETKYWTKNLIADFIEGNVRCCQSGSARSTVAS